MNNLHLIDRVFHKGLYLLKSEIAKHNYKIELHQTEAGIPVIIVRKLLGIIPVAEILTDLINDILLPVGLKVLKLTKKGKNNIPVYEIGQSDQGWKGEFNPEITTKKGGKKAKQEDAEVISETEIQKEGE